MPGTHIIPYRNRTLPIEVDCQGKKIDDPKLAQFLTDWMTDILDIAHKLGIKTRFSIRATEEEILPKKSTTYDVLFEPDEYHFQTIHESLDIHQVYDAESPKHNYHGRIRLFILVHKDCTAIQSIFADAIMGSYYRKIVKYYSNFETKYIDCPKAT